MLRKFREPVSGFTHLFGVVLSIIGLISLIIHSNVNESLSRILIFSIFGCSLILLYSASSIYHLSYFKESIIKILRKIDHSMIFVLIAGTYTPICLIALKNIWGLSLLIGIWLFAVAGIIIKVFFFNAPRWLSTLFYVLMGWAAIIAIVPLTKSLPLPAILWLFAGGIFYTIGAVIYATKKPKITFKYIGFHEIFHIFVLAGSLCHYWLMFKYVMYI